LERKLGVALPEQYRRFLLRHNGGSPVPAGFRIKNEGAPYADSEVDAFLAVHEGKIASFEDFFDTYKVEEKRMPDRLVPIAYDPFGNVVCISVEGPDRGAVYFWDHEHEPDGPESDDSNVHPVADSFDEFLSSLRDEKPPGRTPKGGVEQMVEEDDLDGLRRLLDESSGPEEKEALEWAVGMAAARNKPDVVRFLLDRGAAAATAFGQALGQGHVDLMKMLLPLGIANDDLQFALLSEPVYEDVNLVRMLIAAGADVNRVLPGKVWKKTPLHWAADSGSAAAVKCLLEHGAKPGVPDGLQRIPLHYGVQQRDPEVAKLLIAAGEDVGAKDHGGYTPLDLVKGQAAKAQLLVLAAETDAELRRGRDETAAS
jgi:hypothetical protein